MFSALYAKEAKKGHWADGKNEARYNGKIDVYTNLNAAFILIYMLRLYQMASVSEVVPVSTVTFTVLIYTRLNNNNQYKAW